MVFLRHHRNARKTTTMARIPLRDLKNRQEVETLKKRKKKNEIENCIS